MCKSVYRLAVLTGALVFSAGRLPAPGGGGCPACIRLMEDVKAQIVVFSVEGAIDNEGIANSLSRKMDAAENQAMDGDNVASSNIVGSFADEVRAQEGQHITVAAAGILQDQAELIICGLSPTCIT